jgi:hypothetical protein
VITWAQVREWLRPPRRLRFTRAGGFFTAGVIALGFATLNTGNNLLYLLLGALLGLIVVSGWLSEQAIRNIRIGRRAPHGMAGEPVTMTYEVHNGKRRLPTLALELIEADAPITAFVPSVAAGKTAHARADLIIQSTRCVSAASLHAVHVISIRIVHQRARRCISRHDCRVAAYRSPTARGAPGRRADAARWR